MQLNILAGIPIGLREMLEALLITLLMYEILKKNYKYSTKFRLKFTSLILLASVIVSIGVAIGVYYGLQGIVQVSAIQGQDKLVEGIIALVMVLALIWMVFHMAKMKKRGFDSGKDFGINPLFRIGILMFIAVFRETFETLFFIYSRALSDEAVLISQSYGVLIGVVIAIAIIGIIKVGLFKVRLKLIFNITLVYLIFQTAYVFGYGLHEISEYIVENSISNSPIFNIVYNLRSTILSRNETLGIILNVIFGYYDRPEIIMIFGQAVLLGSLLTSTFFYATLIGQKLWSKMIPNTRKFSKPQIQLRKRFNRN